MAKKKAVKIIKKEKPKEQPKEQPLPLYLDEKSLFTLIDSSIAIHRLHIDRLVFDLDKIKEPCHCLTVAQHMVRVGYKIDGLKEAKEIIADVFSKHRAKMEQGQSNNDDSGKESVPTDA